MRTTEVRNVLLATLMLISANISIAAEPIAGVGPTSSVEKVRGGFEFLEGPTRGPDGSLYFSDIPPQTIYRLDPQGKIEEFLKPSAHANGLMFAGENKLLACQMDGQIAAIDLANKKVTILSDGFEGKRFNACNDLVIDRQGGIYFTDPRFRAPQPWPQGTEAFYYRAADGKVTRLGQDLAAPNGIILSPDEKTLYVIPSMQRQMFAFEILEPGKLGPKQTFCELKQREGSTNGGGDGLTVDVQGRLYITSALGIQVFDSAGKLLGIIEVPEQPANVTFGGPQSRTLFITARTGLYRCEMEVAGHQFRSQ